MNLKRNVLLPFCGMLHFECLGLSVFRKDKTNGVLYHTYSTFAAGLGSLSSVLSLIDLTPDGRQEKERGRNMFWIKHKEMYEGTHDDDAGKTSADM